MILPKIVLFSLLVVTLGCDPAVKSDPRMIPSHVVEMQQAVSADIYLRMFSGNLILGAKAKALMVGTYHYNSPVWVPVMTYQEADQKGRLMLTQERIPTIGSFAKNDAMNQWDIQLNKNVPLELTIEFGRGQGFIDLNELDLKQVKLINKNGKMNMDISGRELKEDLVLWINNENGDLDITLPKNVGIRVSTVRGAKIIAEGLKQENAIYKNELDGTAAKHIFVDIKSDAGTVVFR